MKVKQLIEALQKCNPEHRVVVSGYEGGYCDATDPTNVRLALNVNDPDKWYYGPHDLPGSWAARHSDKKRAVPCVLLSR